MEVHFLGTTGYHPNSQRHTMCVMLPELGLVLDAGTGFFRVREHLVTRDLNILLSHTHLDHVVGLSFLFDVPLQEDSTAHVYATKEKLVGIESHLFHPTLFPVRPPFTGHGLIPDPNEADAGGGRFELGCGTRVRWFPVDHPGGAIGFRLRLPNGRVLAYITDTTASADAAYRSEIQDVDLLIHECYFDDGAEEHARLTGHSCLTPVLDLVRDCRPGRTALVHLNPVSERGPQAEKVARLARGMSVCIPDDGTVLTV